MNKNLLTTAGVACLLVASCFVNLAIGQNNRSGGEPSDSALLALVNKYVHTPVSRTARSNGDVFLQRDMTAYLQSTVLAPDVPQAQRDHGHDHKDAMLVEFLNRPHPNVMTLNKYFDEAAVEFGVPAALLKATAQVQSNWAQVSESIYGSWGMMGLIENHKVHQITTAAQLLRLPADAIKNDARTNIRAAAALLASYTSNNSPVHLEDWFDEVKKLTGLWDEALAHDLALRIYDVVKGGSKTVSLWGEIINLQSEDVSVSKDIAEAKFSSSTSRTANTNSVDYPNAVSNFTTCNYNSRPAGSTIKYYFVHYVATGTYQGAINWFKDCSSSVSAHYVVRNRMAKLAR